MRKIIVASLALLALLLSACTTALPAPSRPADAPPAPPSAAVSAPALLPAEAPPGGAEREFKTDFSRHTVPYAEILSGGPPKDGIPAIDNPKFVTVAEADAWLRDVEPVVLVQGPCIRGLGTGQT